MEHLNPTDPPEEFLVAPEDCPAPAGCEGHRRFVDLQEAILQAKPGTRIHLQGFFHGHLVLSKPIELVGREKCKGPNGMTYQKGTLFGDDWAVHVNSPGVILRNLDIIGSGPIPKTWRCAVKVSEGDLHLEDCKIESWSLAAVEVRGPNAKAVLRVCTVRGSKAMSEDGHCPAILVDGGGSLEMEATSVGSYDRTRGARLLEAADSGRVRAVGCRFHSDSREVVGVLAHTRGQIHLQECEITGQAKPAESFKGGQALLRDCRIEGQAAPTLRSRLLAGFRWIGKAAALLFFLVLAVISAPLVCLIVTAILGTPLAVLLGTGSALGERLLGGALSSGNARWVGGSAMGILCGAFLGLGLLLSNRKKTSAMTWLLVLAGGALCGGAAALSTKYETEWFLNQAAGITDFRIGLNSAGSVAVLGSGKVLMLSPVMFQSLRIAFVFAYVYLAVLLIAVFPMVKESWDAGRHRRPGVKEEDDLPSFSRGMAESIWGGAFFGMGCSGVYISFVIGVILAERNPIVNLRNLEYQPVLFVLGAMGLLAGLVAVITLVLFLIPRLFFLHRVREEKATRLGAALLAMIGCGAGFLLVHCLFLGLTSSFRWDVVASGLLAASVLWVPAALHAVNEIRRYGFSGLEFRAYGILLLGGSAIGLWGGYLRIAAASGWWWATGCIGAVLLAVAMVVGFRIGWKKGWPL